MGHDEMTDAALAAMPEVAKMPDLADTANITVTVAFSPRAGVVDEVSVSLRAGSTLADALRASGLQQRHPTHDLAQLPLGVWGALREAHGVLREADRIELYRPLEVDPKEARRRRQQAQRGAIKRSR